MERRVVPHHGAEHHLIVAALRAPDPAGHPRVHKDRDAFVIPARRRHSRRSQVEVQDGFRLVGHRQHLPAEQLPENTIPRGRLIHGRHVDQLVIHDRVDPLVGGNRLEREAQRRDLNPDQIVGNRGGAGVPHIGQIHQQHRQVPMRLVPEESLLESERIQRRARGMRKEEGLAAIHVHQPQAGRSLLAQLRGGRPAGEREEKQLQSQHGREPGPFVAHYEPSVHWKNRSLTVAALSRRARQ